MSADEDAVLRELLEAATRQPFGLSPGVKVSRLHGASFEGAACQLVALRFGGGTSLLHRAASMTGTAAC